MTSAPAPAPVTFWYEFASTYSYLAAWRIEALAAAAQVTVRWQPFLLGPIFAAQGWNTSPFVLYPAKGAYMWRDMARECARLGLPLRLPSVFPRHSLLAARVALLIEEQAPERLPAYSRAVFAANFAEDQDIAAPAVLCALLDRLDLPGADLLAAAPTVKDRLRARGEAAQNAGIFGAPTFVVADEVFWGNDRLEHALAWAVAHTA